MSYKEECIKAMEMLAKDPRVIFIGQNVLYSGSAAYETLQTVPDSKKIELPVAEDMQMGMSIGLSLEGYIPVSVYPRMDFLICATNQLVNHLDKIEEMSVGRFKPKVIIRTFIGAEKPLYPGAQHCQDHTLALRYLLSNIEIHEIDYKSKVVPIYRRALKADYSTVIVESMEKIREG